MLEPREWEIVDRLNEIFWENYDGPGRGVDQAIEEIRIRGIADYEKTGQLLKASCYGKERPGSVTSLVLAVGEMEIRPEEE